MLELLQDNLCEAEAEKKEKQTVGTNIKEEGKMQVVRTTYPSPTYDDRIRRETLMKKVISLWNKRRMNFKPKWRNKCPICKNTLYVEKVELAWRDRKDYGILYQCKECNYEYGQYDFDTFGNSFGTPLG